jgi:hypothetical protein
VALTSINSQGHCRSRGLAQLVHNISESLGAPRAQVSGHFTASIG